MDGLAQLGAKPVRSRGRLLGAAQDAGGWTRCGEVCAVVEQEVRHRLGDLPHIVEMLVHIE